ncbi:Gluconate 2-dehydrogenase (acceptor) [Gluconacetobacter diazotrophicus PA1 5]|uniref:Gluconate 2-dehydrogenase subunit 3 family protein n=2 Tax=Gluconacetobacter diazotrophicus TaxID=33996 RepID=A0A7W4FEC8_GLUDI|nr:gluconate 2-dehydrogenase subunit 3 family protein [Gluconacetobacter diazotrophicus]ACI50948.1 Gluconate 2-dehydrogenase (acceptor) [Gluconacetobacter diazotrophicus PA1 5]MBB2156117.1 gluconate 2-dehydrogenase subunit 3 family protein [Gluconacetobacter diazotrophicus]TWB08597.1 gluconate 2-dehydrogenase gamma chain [Gluconacetobacter diazotrophicus]CAP54797.1 putative gluconate 2-dehydrogenase subunit 3 precursor [Gluconacetobacter diazotrophicus PA1 5]
MQGLAGAAALGSATLPARAARSTERSSYTPGFFSQPEWAFLHAACDRLIPEDAVGPGAIALGVPEFIDRQMETPYAYGKLWYMQAPFVSGPDNLGYQLPFTPRDIYRKGIAGAEAFVKAKYGQSFHALDAATRDVILQGFETGDVRFGDLPASVFFAQLLNNTMEGAFSDPIHGGNKGLGGWTTIGFPGARADFMDWVDQYGKEYPLGTVSISGETA